MLVNELKKYLNDRKFEDSLVIKIRLEDGDYIELSDDVSFNVGSSGESLLFYEYK